MYLKNTLVAEEITQDILLSLWKHRQELPDIVNFPGYVYVMTRNRTNNIFREKILSTVEPPPDLMDSLLQNPAGVLEYRQLYDTLMQGINALPPRRQEVFQLNRLQGLSYEAVADQLGISKSAVKQHVIESLVFLRTFLRQHFVTLIGVMFSSLSFC